MPCVAVQQAATPGAGQVKGFEHILKRVISACCTYAPGHEGIGAKVFCFFSSKRSSSSTCLQALGTRQSTALISFQTRSLARVRAHRLSGRRAMTRKEESSYFLRKEPKNSCSLAFAQVPATGRLVITAQEEKFFGSFFQKITYFLSPSAARTARPPAAAPIPASSRYRRGWPGATRRDT